MSRCFFVFFLNRTDGYKCSVHTDVLILCVCMCYCVCVLWWQWSWQCPCVCASVHVCVHVGMCYCVCVCAVMAMELTVSLVDLPHSVYTNPATQALPSSKNITYTRVSIYVVFLNNAHSLNAWARNIANAWLPCTNIWETLQRAITLILRCESKIRL